MKKKALSIFLFLSLVATTLLAGCTTTAVPTASPSATKAVTPPSQTETNTPVPTNDKGYVFNETGLPIVEGDVTFTVWTSTNIPEADVPNLPINKMVSEATGVWPTWVCISPASAAEKKSLMWASGDYPNVLGPGFVSTDDMNIYGPMGIVLPLNELFEKYAVQLNRYADDSVWAYLKCFDGNMYYIPTLTEPGTWKEAFAINKTWLDRLDLEMPVNYAEFVEVLRVFKREDANGNGDTNDEIPFALGPVYSSPFDSWDSFFGIFGTPGNYQINDSGKVINGYLVESFKEGLIELQKLYNEGLLDAENFTIDTGTFNARGKAQPAVYGVVLGYIMNYHTGSNHAEYTTMPVLCDENGNKTKVYIDRIATMNITPQMAITISCECPEIVMRWADYMMEPIISVQVDSGPIGIRFDPTTLRVNEKIPEGYNTWNEWHSAFIIQALPRIITPKGFADYNIPWDKGELVQAERDLRDQLYLPYAVTPFPYINATQDELAELALYKTDVDKYMRETTATWITGNANIEDEWATYLATMDQLGAQKILNVMQQQYERYLTLMN